MPFLDSLDIANRGLQLLGVNPILSVTEDSNNNLEMSAAYDRVRRAELQRSYWRFAIKRAVLRAMDTTTLMLVPGVYDASKTYLLGEVVQDTNGLFWLSLSADNIGNTPGGNNDAWDMYFGPMTAALWASGGSYYAGELVYLLNSSAPNGYQLYLSLTNANSDTPNTATAWSGTVQYKQDDVVSSAGSQWRSLLAVNVNNTPADAPANWSPLTTYSTAQTVTGSNNHIYSSVSNGNLNHDPTTDGGVNWTDTLTLAAWSRTPTILPSSTNWRPITATLRNPVIIYPIAAGPSSQAATKNVYRLPAGYMRTAPQLGKSGDSGALGSPSGLLFTDWQYDSDYIISSDTGPIILRFVADVTRVSKMNDMFCEGLACRLAAATCFRLTQSNEKLQTIASEYTKFMGEARIANAIEEGPVYSEMDEYIAVRA